ncbi:MAG: cytochrome c [Bacteroidetes bacterium]|nr:cytochrome c [Bacteroidota bacterium]
MKMNALYIMILLLGCNSTSEKKKHTVQDTTVITQDLSASMQRGELVYMDFCIQCHMGDGAGLPKNFPPLAMSDWLLDKRTESIQAVKYGQKGKIIVNGITYNGLMPPMGLTDAEVADVMNYIMNSWENTQDHMVTTEEVSAVEK